MAVDQSKNAKLTVDQGVKGCVRKAGGRGGRQLRKAGKKKKKSEEEKGSLEKWGLYMKTLEGQFCKYTQGGSGQVK